MYRFGIRCHLHCFLKIMQTVKRRGVENAILLFELSVGWLSRPVLLILNYPCPNCIFIHNEPRRFVKGTE